MHQFHELNMRVIGELPALREKHPNQWVYMYMEGILAVGSSLEEVLEEIRRHNINMSSVIVEYIADDTVQIL